MTETPPKEEQQLEAVGDITNNDEKWNSKVHSLVHECR